MKGVMENKRRLIREWRFFLDFLILIFTLALAFTRALIPTFTATTRREEETKKRPVTILLILFARTFQTTARNGNDRTVN